MDFNASTSVWKNDRIRADDLATTVRVRAAISAALDSETLDPGLIPFLATREHYSPAARYLIALCRTEDGAIR